MTINIFVKLIIAGKQKRARRLFLVEVVDGFFLYCIVSF